MRTKFRILLERVKRVFGIIRAGGRMNYTLNSLRKGGASIGEKVHLYSSDIFIDPTRPWLLTIGNYVKITHHVIILTHDYSLSVMRRRYGEWIGEGQETKIGDNCFIGMGAIILMGTEIGNNCIVGAGSVVHGKFPDDVVIAGNPARVICTLEEHYKKRMQKTKEEALECARVYYRVFKRKPTPQDMAGFKFLFTPRDEEHIIGYRLNFICTGDEPSEVEEAFFASKPIWNGFDEMLEEAFRYEKNN